MGWWCGWRRARTGLIVPGSWLKGLSVLRVLVAIVGSVFDGCAKLSAWFVGDLAARCGISACDRCAIVVFVV